MKQDRQEVLHEFSEKVVEICQHADQVEKMKFTANLRNGTSFSFRFDSDTFDKDLTDEHHYTPVSVFNSIIDIIGAGICAFAIVLLSSQVVNILFAAFLFCMFTFAALGHLLDEHQSRACKVFTILTEAFKIVSLCLYCGALANMTQNRVSALLAIILMLGALSLLLLSIQTKGAAIASKIVAAAIPCFALLSKASLLCLGASLLFCLWEIGSVVISSKSKASTNNIFAVIGVIMSMMVLLGF